MKFKIPSISTIVILIIACNVFFDDDDEDTKNVDVNKNDENSIVQEFKEVVKEVKAEVKNIIKTAKEEFNNDICIEVTCYEHYGAPSNLPEPFIVAGSIDNPVRIKTFEEDDKRYSTYSPRGGNWLKLKSYFDLDPDDDWESCSCTDFASRKEKPIVVEHKKIIEADEVVINTKEIIIVNEDRKEEKLFSDQPKEEKVPTLPKLESLEEKSTNQKPLFRSID